MIAAWFSREWMAMNGVCAMQNKRRLFHEENDRPPDFGESENGEWECLLWANGRVRGSRDYKKTAACVIVILL